MVSEQRLSSSDLHEFRSKKVYMEVHSYQNREISGRYIFSLSSNLLMNST